jgi:hypothetical protein
MRTNEISEGPSSGAPRRSDEGPAAPPSHWAPLLDDVGVARLLRMAPATIRVQRFRRRRNLPHWLRIDPIYVGSRPRYRQTDVAEWMTTIGSEPKAVTADCLPIGASRAKANVA